MATALDSNPLQCQFIGQSEAVLEINDSIERIARYQVPVLILGETGTGKEIVAKAIHERSGLPKDRFVAINCGAYPEELVINELFGHEKGAFTGAVGRQLGVVCQADGGTLFLDEVDSLSPAAQVVLLRFLQEKEYRPLGSTHLYHANVRVISASNTDIDLLVERCVFRRDLLYRLDVMRLALPPLRERGDDILLLINFFIKKFAAEYQIDMPKISEAETQMLLDYHWPGNVRELENHIQRYLLLGKFNLPNRLINPPTSETTDIAEDSSKRVVSGVEVKPILAAVENKLTPGGQDMQHAKAEVIQNFERHYLTKLLAETDGNITLAAKIAGKERRSLGRLLKKHEIDRLKFAK